MEDIQRIDRNTERAILEKFAHSGIVFEEAEEPRSLEQKIDEILYLLRDKKTVMDNPNKEEIVAVVQGRRYKITLTEI
jgi:hypothetical protein